MWFGKSFSGTVIDVPTVNEFFEDEDEAVINVGCGAFHTACITEGNLLYGFEAINNMQLAKRIL